MRTWKQVWESTGVHDDRGNPVRISQRRRPKKNDWFKRWLFPDEAAKKSVIGRLKQIGAIAFAVWGFVFFFGMASFVVIGLFRIGPRSVAKAVAMLVAFGVPMCLCMGGFVYLLARFTGIEKKQFTMLMGRRLGQKQCASCEYELADLPVAQDGCTVCPECSAAWRLDIWVRDWGRRKFDRATRFPGKWRVYPIDMGTRPLLIARTQKLRVRSLWAALLIRQLIPNWIDLSAFLFIVAIDLNSQPVQQSFIASLSCNELLALILIFLIPRCLWTTMAAYKRVIRKQVKHNLCPHCENSLRPEPSHGDNASLCSNCGAAWPAKR